MRGIFLAGVAALSFAAGCTDRQRSTNSTLTRRQQDSILGESRLPGAQGVRKALAIVDSAAAREARLESIDRGQP